MKEQIEYITIIITVKIKDANETKAPTAISPCRLEDIIISKNKEKTKRKNNTNTIFAVHFTAYTPLFLLFSSFSILSKRSPILKKNIRATTKTREAATAI
jgi:hypothetical protein